jgi:thiol-disulfide isomerase/thioredoxin
MSFPRQGLPDESVSTLHGQLSVPWWELSGRLCFGLWFIPVGLVSLGGGMLRLTVGSSMQAVSSATTLALGLVFVATGGLALTGRCGMAGWVQAVSLLLQIGVLAGLFAGAQAEGPPASLHIMAELGFPLAGLTWIGGRSASQGQRNRILTDLPSIAFTVIFVVCLPVFGSRIGTALGILAVPPPESRTWAPGQRIPPVRFQSPGGEWVRVDEPGVTYVVNFWATWCGSCREELPALLDMLAGLPPDSGVRLLAVNTENLSEDEIKAFLEQEVLDDLPVFVDPRRFREVMGVRTLPLTLLIRDREILARHQGFDPAMIPRIREEIMAARKH